MIIYTVSSGSISRHFLGLNDPNICGFSIQITTVRQPGVIRVWNRWFTDEYKKEMQIHNLLSQFHHDPAVVGGFGCAMRTWTSAPCLPWKEQSNFFEKKKKTVGISFFALFSSDQFPIWIHSSSHIFGSFVWTVHTWIYHDVHSNQNNCNEQLGGRPFEKPEPFCC